jgi:hypothetical protein
MDSDVMRWGAPERCEASGGRRRRWRVVAGVCLSLVVPAVLASASGGAVLAEQPSACPQRALTKVPVNGWAAARRELVPKGPTALWLCRYPGLGTSVALGLGRSRQVTETGLIAQLAGEFDTLPPYPGLTYRCPLDDGSQILALLRYAGGERVTVALATTGCRRVTNGDLVRVASGYHDTPVAQRLDAELSTLTAAASGDARVTGLVRLCGGPAPSRCATQNETVTALDGAGEVVAAVATTHARFSFSLPPGTYTLLVTTGLARGRRTVVLTAGRTTHANIVVPLI